MELLASVYMDYENKFRSEVAVSDKDFWLNQGLSYG